LTKIVWASYVFGDFFTNSSGHPAPKLNLTRKSITGSVGRKMSRMDASDNTTYKREGLGAGRPDLAKFGHLGKKWIPYLFKSGLDFETFFVKSSTKKIFNYSMYTSSKVCNYVVLS
jgi:hypothetical protein